MKSVCCLILRVIGFAFRRASLIDGQVVIDFVDLEKIAQHKSCEFRFYLGTLLRTVAWEIASQ